MGSGPRKLPGGITVGAVRSVAAQGHLKDTKLSIETKALLLSEQKMLWSIVGCRFAGPGLQSRGAPSFMGAHGPEAGA